VGLEGEEVAMIWGLLALVIAAAFAGAAIYINVAERSAMPALWRVEIALAHVWYTNLLTSDLPFTGSVVRTSICAGDRDWVPVRPWPPLPRHWSVS